MKSKMLEKLVAGYRRVIKKKDAKIIGLENALREKSESFVVKMPVQFPKQFEIANIPEVQKVEVTNPPKEKDVQKVEVTNPPEPINLKPLEKALKENKPPETQKVEVTNADNPAKWATPVILTAVAGLSALWTKLWKRGITVKLDPEERTNPIPVVVVDPFGRPVPVQPPARQVFLPMGGGRSLPPGPPTSIGTGTATVTTPGTVVALASGKTPCTKIYITAPSSNTGAIYIGDRNVNAQAGTQQGAMILPIGSMTLEIDDVSKIYIDAEQPTDKVTFTYIK